MNKDSLRIELSNGLSSGRKEAKRRFTRAEMGAWLGARGVTLIGADLDESPMAYRRLRRCSPATPERSAFSTPFVRSPS